MNYILNKENSLLDNRIFRACHPSLARPSTFSYQLRKYFSLILIFGFTSLSVAQEENKQIKTEKTSLDIKVESETKSTLAYILDFLSETIIYIVGIFFMVILSPVTKVLKKLNYNLDLNINNKEKDKENK